MLLHSLGLRSPWGFSQLSHQHWFSHKFLFLHLVYTRFYSFCCQPLPLYPMCPYSQEDFFMSKTWKTPFSFFSSFIFIHVLRVKSLPGPRRDLGEGGLNGSHLDVVTPTEEGKERWKKQVSMNTENNKKLIHKIDKSLYYEPRTVIPRWSHKFWTRVTTFLPSGY